MGRLLLITVPPKNIVACGSHDPASRKTEGGILFCVVVVDCIILISLALWGSEIWHFITLIPFVFHQSHHKTSIVPVLKKAKRRRLLDMIILKAVDI